MPDTASDPLYRRAVLGLNGGPTDRLVVRLGCKLAREQGTELVALHIVEVDWRHDLSEDLATDSEVASAVLDFAEATAEKSKVGLQTELIQARDVGAALVDESTELGADVIILGLPYRKRFGGDFAIGRTVPYVLQNAPASVLVIREPVASSEERRTDTMQPAYR